MVGFFDASPFFVASLSCCVDYNDFVVGTIIFAFYYCYCRFPVGLRGAGSLVSNKFKVASLLFIKSFLLLCKSGNWDSLLPSPLSLSITRWD